MKIISYILTIPVRAILTFLTVLFGLIIIAAIDTDVASDEKALKEYQNILEKIWEGNK